MDDTSIQKFYKLASSYLVRRFETVNNEKLQLLADNRELLNKLTSVEAELQKLKVERIQKSQAYSTPQRSSITKMTDSYRKSISLNDRILFASKDMALMKRQSAALRMDLDIHKLGRKIVQMIKKDNAQLVTSMLEISPFLLTMRSFQHGQTILHIAAASGARDCCIALLKFPKKLRRVSLNLSEGILLKQGNEFVGFDPQVTDVIGQTALHYAGEASQPEVCEVFNNLFPHLKGDRAPLDAGGLTPAAASSLKRPRTQADRERRKYCISLLHKVGDPCISPRAIKRSTSFSAKPSRLKQVREDSEFGVCAMPGLRVSMEDTTFSEPRIYSKGGVVVDVYGVMDGHGGSLSSTFCARRFPVLFKEQLESLNKDLRDKETIKEAIWNATFMVEKELRQRPECRLKRIEIQPTIGGEPAKYGYESEDNSGTTLLVVAVIKISGPQSVVVANIGDCRAIFFRSRNGQLLNLSALSRDHKPYEKMGDDDGEFFAKERRRIEEAGGLITEDNYVLWDKTKSKDKLNMTRAIGDFKFKSIPELLTQDQPIVCTPEFRELDITDIPVTHDDSIHLFLACDGIWDVMTNSEAAESLLNALRKVSSMPDAVQYFLLECLQKGSEDNLSGVLIKLDIENPKSENLRRALQFEDNVSTIDQKIKTIEL